MIDIRVTKESTHGERHPVRSLCDRELLHRFVDMIVENEASVYP